MFSFIAKREDCLEKSIFGEKQGVLIRTGYVSEFDDQAILVRVGEALVTDYMLKCPRQNGIMLLVYGAQCGPVLTVILKVRSCMSRARTRSLIV